VQVLKLHTNAQTLSWLTNSLRSAWGRVLFFWYSFQGPGRIAHALRLVWRLREPISPFSVINSDQLWQLFSLGWTILLLIVIHNLDSGITAKYLKRQASFYSTQVSFSFHSLRCSEILVSPNICTVNSFASNSYLQPRFWYYCQIFKTLGLLLLNAGLFPFSLSEMLWDALRYLYLRISAQRFEPGGFIERGGFESFP